MSDTTTDVKPAIGSERIILAIVAVAVLAFGGTLLGGWAPEPRLMGDPMTAVQRAFDEAGDPVAYVDALYAGGDADLFFFAVSAEAAGLVGATPEQLRQFTQQWVAVPTDVVGDEPVDVYGTEIAVVQALNAQGSTTWCVRTDGILLPFCAIGAIPVEVATGGIALQADTQVGVLVPDVAFVQLTLMPTDGPLTIGGGDQPVEASSEAWADAELTRLDPFAGPVPVAPGEVIEPGTQLLLTVQQFHDLSAPLDGGTITIFFEEGPVEVQIGQPELLLDGGGR